MLLFIGIGAMIDFGPLLQNPFLLLFGAAAQFGIFFTIIVAVLFGFDLNDAASIAIIGAADGPTSIFVANTFEFQIYGSNHGCSLFLYGFGADHSAGCDQGGHNEKRAFDSYELSRWRSLANSKNSFFRSLSLSLPGSLPLYLCH